jgi:hypothetical protein
MSEGVKTAREEGTDEAQFSCLSGRRMKALVLDSLVFQSG